MGLLEFLQLAKSKLADVAGYDVVHVVIGNEACDLDSAVSAIVYAYVLHHISRDQKILHIPVLNIPKNDYSLKTDVTYALGLYDITAQDITFRDEIDLGNSDKKLKLTLVDFNVFPERDKNLEDVVVEVLDHHKPDRSEKEGVDVQIEMVGSCCTLVAERVFKKLDEDMMSKEALWLLYGSILLDTVCLSESAGRTTAKDLAMIEALEERLPNPSRTAVFDKLQAAKFDISSLSTIDILRKDLKTTSNNENVDIAISSVPVDIKEFLERKDLLPALSSVTTQQGAAALVIMALYVDQQREPHRQLAVYSTNPALLDQVEKLLRNAKEPSLALGANFVSPSQGELFACPQGNPRVSRKVLLPLIHEAMNTMDSSGDVSQVAVAVSDGEPLGEEEKEANYKTENTPDLDVKNDEQQGEIVDEEVSSGNFDAPNENSEKSHFPVCNQEKTLNPLDALDPFHNETNIVLEHTPDDTQTATPTSDLSNRSSRSESPEPSAMNRDTSSNLLLPGFGGSLGVPGGNIIPVTPINSPTESPSGSNVTSPQGEADLPSFNSSEMVQKIREKKASIGGSDDISNETDNFPFTPANSLANDASMEYVARDRSLPTFLNKEMVNRINDKKSALESFAEELSDDEFQPQPPKNSYTDSPDHMGGIGHDLSKLDGAAIEQMLEVKRASLGYYDDEADTNHDQDSFPFTPQSSLVDSNLEIHAKDSKLSGFEGSGSLDMVDQQSTSNLGLDTNEDPLVFAPPNSFSKSMASDSQTNMRNNDDLVNNVQEVSVNLEDVHDASPTGNVVAYNIAQEMLSMSNNELGDMGHVQVGTSESHGVSLMRGNSDIEVAGKIVESVIQQASEIVQQDQEIGSASYQGTQDVREYGKEFTPTPPMIIIEDMSEDTISGSSPNVGYAMEGISMKTETCADSMDSGNETFREELSEASDSPISSKDSEEVMGRSVDSPTDVSQVERPSMNFESDCSTENSIAGAKADGLKDASESLGQQGMLHFDSEHGDMDVEDSDKALETIRDEKYEDRNQAEAKISEGVLLLGSDPGESHTEPNLESDPEPEIPDPEPLVTADGILQLGADPGESNTDPVEPDPEQNQVSASSPDPEPKISSDGILDLGADPGESSTDQEAHVSDPTTQNPNTPTKKPSDGMQFSNAKNQILTTVEVHRYDVAEEKVTMGLSSAVVLSRQQPDGSTAPRAKRQPPDGSIGPRSETEGAASTMTEVKLTKQQRTHLEGVRKALDIDLDLSSEDDEEIKNLKDQIPEELTTPAVSNTAHLDNVVDRPTTLDSAAKKKIVPNLDLLNDNDIEIPTSPFSTDDDFVLSFDGEKTPDDLKTPDALNDSMFGGELDWGSSSSSAVVTPVEPIPEYTAREEFNDARHWKSVQIGERWYKIDMKVIEPYKKVLSHGGYYGDGFNAIVVFTACYLPDRRRRDYHYVMDNLFLYVISTLDLLVVEDYMIVYFHGATPRHKMPSLRWLKRCYDMIDRRLRKNLKALLVVHPTIWLKTLVFMTKPFVSSKFTSKLRYIKNLEELTKAVPTEYIFVPEEVQQCDRYSFGKTTPKRKFINL